MSSERTRFGPPEDNTEGLVDNEPTPWMKAIVGLVCLALFVPILIIVLKFLWGAALG